jgi:hypothetical protein
MTPYAVVIREPLNMCANVCLQFKAGSVTTDLHFTSNDWRRTIKAPTQPEISALIKPTTATIIGILCDSVYIAVWYTGGVL